MASRLLLELVNMIFDELLLLTRSRTENRHKGFMRTLHACSLVCKAWALPAQRRIFTYISLYFMTDEPKDLLRILDTNPHIAPFVKHLTIVFKNFHDVHKYVGVIRPLAEHIKDVSELELLYVSLWNEEWCSTLVTSFKSIRYLKLHESVLKFDVFAAVLKNHPHIETLILGSLLWWDEKSSALKPSLDADTPLETGTLPKLRNISFFQNVMNSKFVDWMILQQCTRNIQEATFVCVAPSEAPALGRLINDIGRALKHLTIRRFESIDTVETVQGDLHPPFSLPHNNHMTRTILAEVARSISLANCIALHTLELMDTYSINTNLEWLLGVLAGVASTEIETIHLCIDLEESNRLNEDASLDRINLSRIDDILVRANFGTLRKVYLQFGYPMPRSDWQREEVVGRLNGINQRGILEVV